jgi:hypothetical protein
MHDLSPTRSRGSVVSSDPDRPAFVHVLSSGLSDTVEPAELPPDLQADLDRRCDEFREARARAEVSSRDYIIY